LKRFKDKKFNVLVATDVASRGLDIPNVDLVIQVEPPKDTETYIHRSGRTARAGKSGTCITFFTMKQKQQIQFIEHKAGIKIQRIGIPQPEDVIKASSRDTIKNLKEVNDEVLGLFEDAADQLILEHDGDTKKALLKTLAFISGQYKAKLTGRSLLNGQEGATTFELRLNKQFFGVSLVWNILRKYVPEDMTREIKGMRCFADQTGAVFDVLESHAERFEDIFNHLKNEARIDFSVSRSMTLPDLKEDADQGMGGNMGGGYGGQRNQWGGNQGMRG
jgi:ATP-dependent RNA helicase DDX21